MSELIQQLADQARAEVPKGILAPDLWIEQYNEIFGRLIIYECIKVIHKQERVPEGFFYAKSANIHELKIQQHFGVAE